MFWKFLINNLWQIGLTVIGGMITVGLIELAKYLSLKFRRYKFKAVFGKDLASSDAFHIVYTHLKLPVKLFNEHGKQITHPYVKPEEPITEFGFSIERPVSSCEVRAAKYLATSIGLNIGNAPILSSDYEIKGRLNISFISIGGFSNYKSIDAMENGGNKLIRLSKEPRFISSSSEKPIRFDVEEGFDYGLILKIHPKQFPKRIWIVCVGLGEWGSSGAAWYLANKWKEIYGFVKSKPFACIVKVKSGQDESSEPIIYVRSERDLESLLEEITPPSSPPKPSSSTSASSSSSYYPSSSSI